MHYNPNINTEHKEYGMPTVFYLPEPNFTGVWPNTGDKAASPEYKDGVSVFKFTIDKDDAPTAVFSVCDEPYSQKTALGGLRKGWVSSVCHFEGFPPPNSRSMKSLTNGIAIRQEGGAWKVQIKTKVQFSTDE